MYVCVCVCACMMSKKNRGGDHGVRGGVVVVHATRLLVLVSNVFTVRVVTLN